MDAEESFTVAACEIVRAQHLVGDHCPRCSLLGILS